MALTASFSGKKVLVTGGASGIGRQIVQRLYDDDAIVCVVDKNAEAVQVLKEELPNVQAEVVDLTHWKETRRAVESFGVLDYLVNNAAVVVQQNFLEITEESAYMQYTVNLGAVINISQAVAKKMMEVGNGGAIVNISSMAAQTYVSKFVYYGATKAALTMLTKSMAVELGAFGIRVNCIQPGPVDSPLTKDEYGNPLGEAHRLVNQSTLKRMIDPDEIADLVLFLLSSRSSMITGEAVRIDGGIL